MRSEETMPLRRGGCGDDCMPTTSVNEKNEDGREREREPSTCFAMHYYGLLWSDHFHV